ncbi:MAG: hypothetical protein HW421_912 [Ignavibacteria bacterium]|nr:hypothetical protein [Ignavibacteria bacterium]
MNDEKPLASEAFFIAKMAIIREIFADFEFFLNDNLSVESVRVVCAFFLTM